MSEDALRFGRRLAEAASGCALAVGLLRSAARWTQLAGVMGSELARLRVVDVLSAYVAVAMELEEGDLGGGAPLIELGGPARGLLEGLITWNGEGDPPASLVACAQSATGLLGHAQNHAAVFRATEMPTFPGVEPAEDDPFRLGDDQLMDEIGELRVLLQRLLTQTRARYLALFDRSAALVHCTLPGVGAEARAANATLRNLADTPELLQDLRHVDLFTGVRRAGESGVTVLRLAGARATLVAELDSDADADALRAPELHELLDILIEAHSSRIEQLSFPTFAPGREDAFDPFR